MNQKGSFLNWMMAKICTKIVRELKNMGLVVSPSSSVDLLAGGASVNYESTKIEKISQAYENSWRHSDQVSSEEIPTVEDFKMAVEDICNDNDISRIVLFIDEAAHNFIQEQQDQFFTLFRDLRCPQISCKAAVYPGVTAYGGSFQPSQDTTLISLLKALPVQPAGETDKTTNKQHNQKTLLHNRRRAQEPALCEQRKPLILPGL